MNSSSEVETSATSAARPQTWFNVVWFIALVALGLLVAILAALAGIATWLAPDAVNCATVTAVLLVPIVLLAYVRWRRAGRWWAVGVGYALIAPVYIWLASDDAALRHNVSIEDLSPAFPGAEKSYEVLMRYGRSHPLARDFHAPRRIFEGNGPDYVTDITKSDEWRTWLLGHRADIEADWADLAPVRAWWSELAQFDRIADLMPARADAEVLAFQPLRSYAQHAIAVAGLEALDGHGDEAFATLQPLLDVSRNLEPSARSIVRIMVARIAQRMAIETAGFVLDHATVSQAARAKFAVALARGTTGEAGARRLLAVEYAIICGVIHETRAGDLVAAEGETILGHRYERWAATRAAVNCLDGVVLNRIRTLNLYGDLTSEMQDRAAQRQSKQMRIACDLFVRTTATVRIKNLYGLSSMHEFNSSPHEGIVDSYWRVEDERLALLTRL